jgi:predicted ferric reductase
MTHTSWYLARSSGLVAWALLALSMLWGLLLATRVFDRNPGPKWFTDLHRFLGGLAVLFTGIHVAALIGDNYVAFGAKDVLVPFASSWRPVAVAWGVIAMWILLAVEGSSLLMRHLSRRLWRAIHLSSYLLFISATAHAFSAGTDARNELFVVGAFSLGSLISLLVLVRIRSTKDRRRSTSGPLAL